LRETGDFEMGLTFLKETTADWKADYRVPNHTYIMNGTSCVGYVKEGTTEKIMFSKPSSQFNRKGRTFKDTTKEFMGR
jgi:hypothetical protein